MIININKVSSELEALKSLSDTVLTALEANPDSQTVQYLPPGHNLKEISNTFLISGHTLPEEDSVHTPIEMAIKQTTMDIEMRRDWTTLVRLCKKPEK